MMTCKFVDLNSAKNVSCFITWWFVKTVLTAHWATEHVYMLSGFDIVKPLLYKIIKSYYKF